PELHTDAVRIVLAAPLAGLLGRCFAVLQMDTSNVKQPLTKNHLELLVILTHVISAAVEQAEDIEVRVVKDVKRQLAIESERQRLLLESISAPAMSGYRLMHQRLGGHAKATEFVDYVRIPDGRVACVLCDAFKQRPNSECSVTLVFRMLAESLCTTYSAGEALSNAQISMHLRRASIAVELSVAVIVLDPESSTVSVAMAGDFCVNVISNSCLSTLDTSEYSGPRVSGNTQSGLVKEFMAAAPSADGHYQMDLVLNQGDRLLVFTNAISNLDSASGSFMDSDGVRELVSEASLEPSELFEARLSERIVQSCNNRAVRNSIAFVSIQKHSSITAGNVATTVTDMRDGLIKQHDGIGNR
ncbi:MAG: hypothetical protein WBH50_25455, partial [Fuerstiella sp.]